jgi:hypothetical protein
LPTIEAIYRLRYSVFRKTIATVTGSTEEARGVVQDAFATALRKRAGFRQATIVTARCHNGRRAIYCRDGRFQARIQSQTAAWANPGRDHRIQRRPHQPEESAALFPINNYP